MTRAMFRLGEFTRVEGRKEPLRSDRSFLSRSLGWLIGGIWVVCQIVLIAWGTLAIYYSNPPVAALRLTLAAALRRSPCGPAGCRLDGACLRFFCIIFRSSRVVDPIPSHDRPWRPEVAVMPRAIIDGDRVRITGYATLNIVTEMISRRYEDRECGCRV